MLYRREIDGLRAVAVIPVILFHAGFTVFSGGYVGVDVFFVISGYLITNIIITELEQGTFSISGFYERRARRILPALFFVLIFCIFFGWIWMLPTQFREFSHSLVAVGTFVSNVFFWLDSGYFSAAAGEKPLLHTWSLAVEEQYYLLFPILLMLFWRFGRRRVFYGIVTVAVFSLLLSEWGWRNNADANFYLIPTRAWELLAGSICAFFPNNRSQKPSNILSGFGLGLIIFAILFFDNNTPFPSVYALAPVVGTTLIILHGTRETWAARLLSVKGFVGIGLVSYSAYLWHQPLFAFARIRNFGEPEQWQMMMLAVMSLVLAYFTWRYVERPFRKRTSPALGTRRAVFRTASIVSTVFIAFGLYGQATYGVIDRFTPLPNFNKIEYYYPRIDNGWCFYDVDNIRYLNIGEEGLNCYLGAESSAKTAVFFGDSFAGQYEPFWDVVGKQLGLKIQVVTTNWCFPGMTDGYFGPDTSRARRQCAFNRDYLVKNIENFDFVILAGAWSASAGKDNIEDVTALINAVVLQPDKTLILMPSPRLFDRNSVERYIFQPSPENTLRNSSFEKYAIVGNDRISDEAGKFGNAYFLERDSLFRRDGLPSAVTKHGLPFTWEGLHISVYGAKMAATEFLKSPIFTELKALAKSR